MGDGRSFDQALRALDKFIAEQSAQDAPDPGSQSGSAHERTPVDTDPA